MVNDMTSDPLGFAIDQIELIHAIQPMLPQRLLEEGKSYQELVNGYHLSLFRYRNAIDSASRFIGGVYVVRAMRGQPEAAQPLAPVSLQKQQRAMQLLAERLFSPEAFDSFNVSAEYLLAQRRGFSHFGSTEDPKLHSYALNRARSIETQASRGHPRVNLSTQAHREHLLYRIHRALDTHAH